MYRDIDQEKEKEKEKQDPILTLLSDATLADKLMNERLRDLALKRFGQWCREKDIFKWFREDPSNYFLFQISSLLSETSAPLEEFKKILEKFETRIRTMDAEQIFELLSDLNKKSILEIVIKYGLRSLLNDDPKRAVL